MKRKMRVEQAIRHAPVDRVPCGELVITDGWLQTVFQQEQIQFDHRLEFVNAMELDIVCLHPHCADRTTGLPDAQAVVFPDLPKWAATDVFTFAVLDGAVGWGNSIFGFEQLLMQLARGTAEFYELLAAVTALNNQLIERLAGSGINGILLADDIAFNHGTIARPAALRETIFPVLAAQVAYAHQLGLPVFFHSDGKLTNVLDDIAGAGFDGLQCIEALAGMELGEVKQQYGDVLCLWGNLDPAALIEERSSGELEQAVTQIVAAGGSQGLIFGTSSGLFESMRLDSVRTVYQLVKRLTGN